MKVNHLSRFDENALSKGFVFDCPLGSVLVAAPTLQAQVFTYNGSGATAVSSLSSKRRRGK